MWQPWNPNFGEERVYWVTLLDHSPSWKEAGTNERPWRDTPYWLAQHAFLFIPGPPAQG